MARRTVDLQIRGLPAETRDRLRRRARSKGMSMSRYVAELINDDLQRPTLEEWFSELDKHPPLVLPKPASAYVRAGRRELGWGD